MLKTLKFYLKLNVLLCAALMARIDHWDTIRRNIIVEKYDPMEVSLGLLAQLKELDHQRTIILRKLSRRIEIYLPERSPICEKGIVKEGRLFEISDSVNMGVFIKENRTVQLVEAVDKINDLTNIISDEVLEKLKYAGESYRRVSMIVYDDRGIFRIPAVKEENVI